MTAKIDRPVTLDLSTPKDPGLQTRSQGKFDAQSEKEHSKHHDQRQEQEFEADARRLRSLLETGEPTPTAGLPDSKLNPLGDQGFVTRNDATSQDAGPFKLFQKIEQPYRKDSAMQQDGAAKDERAPLPPHAASKRDEMPENLRANTQVTDLSEGIRPFELFSSVPPSSLEPSPLAQPAELKLLDEGLARLARTLLVSENMQGSQTLRMELTAEHFPGVVLEVFKDEGAVVAQFVCSNEHSRTSLARAARWLGESMSSHLKRNTLVRVLTDDPEDPSPVEARHHA